MDLKFIISSEKENIETREWQTGHIPRKLWPSRKAKAKAYKFGSGYSWRVITFECCDLDCRVRILLNEQKQIFRASIGVTENGETKLICDYEFHASEPGWHCHARCDDIAELDSLKTRFGGLRIPKAGAFHRRTEFIFNTQPIDKLSAFNCAIKIYNICATGDLL